MTVFKTIMLALLLGASPLLAQGGPSVLLQPGDELFMRVWPDTTLSGRFRVESDGQAYFPIVGAVQVTGRALEEVRAEIIDGLSDYINSPVVVIEPRFKVTLLGAVRGPGLHWVDPTLTLMDVITQAGGFTENAQPDKIRLIRNQQVFSVDGKVALETGAPTADVALRSGDRIVVPSRGRFSWWTFVRTIMQGATLTFTFITLIR